MTEQKETENENSTEQNHDLRRPTPARLNSQGIFVYKIHRLNHFLQVFLLSKIMCEINTWIQTFALN